MMPFLSVLLLLLPCLTGESSAVDVSEFRWSFDAKSNSTDLTICSAGPLLEQGDVIEVVLIVEISTTSILYEYNGALVDDYCVTFNTSHLVRFPKNNTTYTLLLSTLVEGGLELVTSEASFAMTVDTATLLCSGKALTRAIAPTSATFEDCLSDPSLLGNVCYTEGDLGSSSVCFTLDDSDPPGVRVCLEGSSPTHPVTEDGHLSINFLAYSSSSPSNATVALDVTGAEPIDEAVFWKDGVVQSVSRFFEGPWNTTSFGPHFAEYAVCVLATDEDNQPVISSASSLTDLVVLVAHSVNRDDEDALLQFSFTNANPERAYRVSVWPSLPSSEVPLEADLLDCSDVDYNSTCFRFMEYAGAEKDVFVAIEYANQAEGDVENMVVVPYNIKLLINSTAEEDVWDGV